MSFLKLNCHSVLCDETGGTILVSVALCSEFPEHRLYTHPAFLLTACTVSVSSTNPVGRCAVTGISGHEGVVPKNFHEIYFLFSLFPSYHWTYISLKYIRIKDLEICGSLRKASHI